MNIEKQIDGFDEWYRGVWPDPEMNDKTNQQIHSFKNILAGAWIASRESLVIELPERCLPVGYDYSDSRHDYAAQYSKGVDETIDATTRNIEAAGMKVKL